MYRGRPPHRGGYTPHRGGYPPPYEGRGPAYREDRGRFRPPPHHHHHHHGYHDHGAPEPYRRSSPPRRRHPSPGERRHPSPGERRHPSPGERRHPSPGGGRHPSPGGGRHPSPGGGRHRGGEYWSGRPASRERSQSPRCAIPIDRNLVITVGNELTGPAGSAPPRHLHTPHDRDHSRGRSRPRSCSRDRGRAQSRGRSKSRARSKSRGRSKSRARSPSCSPDHRGRARTRSRSPERSRARSHGRSKSWSRSRSRSRSRGRSYGHSRSGVRSRSRSLSTSSSSSSSSSLEDGGRSPTMEFQELELARRRKEIEELLSKPTKSILKRRPGAEDSPSLRSDSPGGPDSGNISRVAEHLLSVFKGMQPQALASLMAELKADPQMAQRVGLDSELTGILSLLGRAGGAAAAEKEKDKAKDDIEDEEKFLYGDCEEPKPALAHEARAHSFSELYGDMTEEALYGEVPPATAPQSRSTIAPNQNITVHVTNTTYPPGTEPLQESEIQAVEEYDKIQDLLKTIGLDLGVSEITKMAARTKERLHGNKPPPKRRRYSSGSSAGSRGRKSLSGNSDSSQSRGGSWSSGRSSSAGRRTHNRKLSPPAKPHSKQGKSEWVAPPPCDPPPQPPTPHTAIPMPPYSQTPAHPMAPPNYPPPGYGQYGSYMPYMPQQWPPMYPPPGMPLPHQAPREDYPPISPYKRPYNQTIQPDLGPLKSDAQDVRMEVSKEREKNFSDEKNNESQKQKVLEEREKLRQDKEMRMKKKECLMKELERLRKQQGELLRKKRREKDGHKDPLLSQISGLQEHVMRQISELRKEHEAAEKKRTEINKVALILGLSPSDRPRRAARPSRGAGEEEEAHRPPMEKRRRERSWNPEELPHPPNTTKVAASRASPNKAKQSVTASAPPPAPPMATPSELFEYYDAGNHWCKHCNVTSGSMFDFFTHMHSKSHRKTQDPYDRPWASNTPKTVKNSSSEEKMTKPAKGSEFLLPVRGFFCLLCREFYGDGICAEEHVMTHAHNEKYKKQMCENPLYEQRRNLDRQAGLSVDTTGRKRKDEDQSGKDKEEKSKHRKERKDKEKKKGEEEASIPKNEDRENKVKPSKEEAKPAKKEEEERAMFIRQDEDEKYKPLKKEERYKHSREEEYCYRYRREEEELRFRPGRGDDRFRYDDDKYRYSKYPESRDKYDREKDEGRSKGERDVKPSKKNEQPREEPKPEAKKPEPPPKPYDPPKVLCGPSPAMRAKLRKQSSETAKAAPVAMPPNFGKFTWKKKENVLAKEAERVAAEFLKDEEVAAAREPIPVEDSFAKSVAVAKEIALKLSGQPGLPLPWAGQAANPARIRPNLPAPAMALRKTAMLAKPAPLDTFLSIKPPNTGSAEPLPMESPVVPDNPAKDLGGLDIPVPAPVERPVEMPVEAVPEVEQPTQPIETLIRIESDVAAPGVPESEQRRAVFVKPPPFMNSGDGAHKSDKLKTNLAAAKAKDLFDIFLGGLGQSGPFTKPSVTKTNQTAQRKTVQPNPTPQPQRQSNAAPGPSQIGPSPDPKSDQRKPTPPHQPQDICHIQSVALVPKHQVPPAEPNKLKPDLQSSQLQIQPAPPVQSPPQVRSLPQSPPQVCSPPLSQARSPPQVLAQSPPQVQSQTLVCSQPQLQSIPLPLLQPNPQLDQSQVQPQVQPQLLTEIQVDPPQLEQVEPDPDSQPFQPDPASQSTPAPLTPPKTKPKTKTSPQSKKTSPTTRPVRQTRSQTRYQTRQQQQQLSEPESEQVLEHPELVPPSPNGLETGLISASQPEENVPDDTPPNMETLDPAVITPETLGLPSDMMSLGFEYDFNFE